MSRGWVSRIAVACVLAAAFVVDGPVRAQAQRPAFRAGVDLVSLSVTVSAPGQRYVAGLGRDDFTVIENGVAQNLTFFATSGVPLALALLIDTSASMDHTLRTAQEAAIGFAGQLGHADIATVVDFDSTVQIAQGFTNDGRALEDAIRRTAAGGSTALYNAVYISLKELNKLIPQHDSDMPRRRAMIVLSDGDDTSSLVDFEQVLDLASRSDIVIYAIGLGQHEPPGLRNDQAGEFVLRRLAHQTGGRAFFPQQARDLAGVYQSIREELSSQYSLAYESSAATKDGGWRRVTVRVNRPSVVVRTRQGYYAPGK